MNKKKIERDCVKIKIVQTPFADIIGAFNGCLENYYRNYFL